MKTDNEKFTPSQKKAVTAEGKNVLVSASAGSGKTYVMIERVIRLILENKADVKEILAVTYTNAAAEEMKQKLVKAVIAQINAGNDVARMRKTLSDIPTASISTFHAFCGNLIRTYFYALGVDPCAAVADQSQAEELQSKAMDSLFERLYEERNDDFLYLVRIVGRNRNDDNLRDLVKELYTFASSEKSAEEFLKNAASGINEKAFDKAENELFSMYKAELAEYSRIGENIVRDAKELGIENVADNLKDFSVKISHCLASPDFYTLIERALSDNGARTPPIKGDDESLLALKNRVAGYKQDVKDTYGKIMASSPNGSRAQDLADFLETERATRAICELTTDFGKEYAAVKSDAAVLDFGDLEHFAYKLLIDNPDVLSEVRNKYKYVFADEYQDVNGIQEAILSLISHDNAFMVGDVKQSIYAFRGCNPDIIAKKYELYEQGEGETVSLDANFRSTDAVLSSVNKTFSPIMTKDFGGTDYKKNQMLGSGKYPPRYGETVLVTIPEQKKKEQEDVGIYDLEDEVRNPKKRQEFIEGDIVAKIVAAEDGKEIFDVKTSSYRKVSPKDVAVLTRNSSGFPSEIVRHLKRSGIPVSSSVKNPITDYPEIKLLTDLLKIIVRFADDAPLFACLKSAIGGISETEAAEIRRAAISGDCAKAAGKKAKDISFLDCYLWYIEKGENEEIRNKLKNFNDYISKIRLLSDFKSAGEIMSQVLSETGLDLEILSCPNGELRLARVERFISEAEKDERNNSAGKFLTKILNSDEDISVGSSDGDDSVIVTSMHASKGLEYPIVILSGLSKKFNIEDTKSEILTDRYNGIALKLYDEAAKTTKETLVRAAFKKRAKLNLIKEEMRVFYVAMTRAECKLYLVASDEVANNDDYTSVLFANKFSDFIKKKYFDKVYSADDLGESEEREKRQVYISKENRDLTNLIYKNLSYKYPYEQDVQLPVKRAVTSLAEDALTVDEEFIESSAPTDEKARERGIAYHAFLQHCESFYEDAGISLNKIKAEKKLTDEQLALLSEEKLRRILASPLFEDIKGYKLYKEQPFIVPMAANEISPTSATGNVLVQGIIDLLAVKGDKAIIVDYKFSKKGIERLKDTYAYQLALYKKAVEKGLQLTVEKTILFNIDSVESIELN